MPETKCTECPVCGTPVEEMDKLNKDNFISEDPWSKWYTTENWKAYLGKTVAIHVDDGIVASGSNTTEVFEQLDKLGYNLREQSEKVLIDSFNFPTGCS